MGRAHRETPRVLIVHKPVMGGASESLVQLVEAVRHAVDPVVLFHWENEYVERLADAGLRVRVLRAGRERPVRRARGGASSVDRPRAWLREPVRFLRRELPTARRIAEVIRAERPDLVHHDNNPFADRASILAAAMAGVPQLAHVRSLPPYFAPIDRRLCRRLQATVCVSEAARAHHVRALGLAPREVDVVYDPVAPGGELVERDPLAMRARLGLPRGGPLLVNVGRLVPLKGQDLFLRAAALVLARRADGIGGHALVVGSTGPTGAGLAWRTHLEDLVRELGLAGRVHFLGARRDVLEVMRACDLLVHTPTGPEAFGRVLAEALSVERAVVTTHVGGVSEIVVDGETGHVVPRRGARFEPEDVAATIESALEAPDARERMARTGRRWVEEQLDPRVHGRAIAALYARCLGSERGG